MKNVFILTCGLMASVAAWADSFDSESIPSAPALVSSETVQPASLEIAWAQILAGHGRNLQSEWTREHYSLLENDLFQSPEPPFVVTSGLNVLAARDFSGNQIQKVTIVTEKEKKKQDEDEAERKNSKGRHRQP